MGEVAEMMLDGTLCEACGVFIGSDAGFPQYCSLQCANDRGAEWHGKPERSKKWVEKKATGREKDVMLELASLFDALMKKATELQADAPKLFIAMFAAIIDASDLEPPELHSLLDKSMHITERFGTHH